MALQQADANQKIALGVSYEKAYAIPSRSIHANIGGPSIDTDRIAIQTSLAHVVLLCIEIILQAHKLAGVPLTGEGEFGERMVTAGSGATKALKPVPGKELEAGDIVFAYGKDLCIVLDRCKSQYGYTSYKVKYLTKPPLPEVPEDWFPARYVHLVSPRKQAREHVMEIFERHQLPPEAVEKLRAMPDKDFIDYMAKTALAVFEEGGFDHLFKKRG